MGSPNLAGSVWSMSTRLMGAYTYSSVESTAPCGMKQCVPARTSNRPSEMPSLVRQ